MENIPEVLISDIIKRVTKSSDRNSLSLVSKQLYTIEADQRRSIQVGCRLNPEAEAMTKICLCFPNLTKIEITYSGWKSYLGKQLDDQGLFILSTSCHSLTDVTLIRCSFITHLASCLKLVYLSIVECRSINEDSLVKLGNCLRRHKRLEFKIYHPRTHNPFAAESWFRHQICCEKLKELSLAGYVFRQKSGSSLNLGSCSSLEKVYLDACIGLDDSDIISLFEKSRGLKSISLKSYSVSYLTETSFKALSRNYPSLENMELAFPSAEPEWAPSITKFTIDAILALTNSCSIRALVLKDVDFLNDSAMEALSLASPCLETLEIQWISNVTDLGIGFVIEFPCLVNLKITDCYGIIDDGLKPLIESDKSDYLKIKRCPRISYQAAQGAAKHVCWK